MEVLNKEEVEFLVESVLDELVITLDVDRDNDLQVKLHYKDRVISEDYVDNYTIKGMVGNE